jgi:deoxyribodipyrimidine photo-lyase
LIKTNKEIAIFWFRRDLRLFDNAGLYHALNSGFNVLPIFIFDKAILEKLSNKSDARVTFIHEQIEQLNSKLHNYNSSILTFYNYPIEVFKEITILYNIKAVYTNNDYEPYALERDKIVSDLLTSKGIGFKNFKDHVIFEKNEIHKSNGAPYTIYTPYMNQWKQKLKESDIKPFPSEKLSGNLFKIEHIPVISLNELGFAKSSIAIPSPITQEETILNYDKQRNYPNIPTTKIGIHLRFGTISIRMAVQTATNINNTWLIELIWREFFQTIIFHFPHSASKSFKPAYDQIEWGNNEAIFDLWCQGKTGIPIVDAGMRELNQTGFMHNRVRMITASFLCKNLLIDWRWGEAYFAEKLLDYDLASNVGNWQWAAGSGCDAAPYFRVFNPLLQAEKFDKNLEYIRIWIPELETDKYPKPIVDIKLSARKAIDVYKRALKG